MLRIFSSIAILTVLASTLFSQVGAVQSVPKPVDMKLLIIAATAAEPSFTALQAFLDQIGIPHDNIILSAAAKIPANLPALNDAVKGFYQGIILTTGNLAICDTTGKCQSALSGAGWAALDNYAINFGVRTLSYYTFPEPRYGLTLLRGVDTTTSPGTVSLLPAAASIFSYLNVNNPVTVSNAYTYLAIPQAAAGEVTTPL